jgi:hypothetical protein
MVFHTLIASKIKERANPQTNIIDLRNVKPILSARTIPIKMHSKFIKELESLGLVKVIDRFHIELL